MLFCISTDAAQAACGGLTSSSKEGFPNWPLKMVRAQKLLEFPLNIPARLHSKVVIDKPFLIGFFVSSVLLRLAGVAGGVYPAHLPALSRFFQVTPVDPLPVRIALAA